MDLATQQKERCRCYLVYCSSTMVLGSGNNQMLQVDISMDFSACIFVLWWVDYNCKKCLMWSCTSFADVLNIIQEDIVKKVATYQYLLQQPHLPLTAILGSGKAQRKRILVSEVQSCMDCTNMLSTSCWAMYQVYFSFSTITATAVVYVPY